MAGFPVFPEGQIEALARVLGECGSGTDISRVLHDWGMTDNSGESTKWRRLYWIFLECQRRDGCANRIVDFIQSLLIPTQTETEKSEHKGYASLLKGCFAAVRNPLAHEPKVLW